MRRHRATGVAATQVKALNGDLQGDMSVSCLQYPLLCRDSGGEMHPYVHTTDWPISQALAMVLFAALSILGQRHTVLVLGLPGDRRDEDLQAAIAATRTFADAYILHDLQDRRGRAAYEVPRLLRRHLPEHIPCAYAPDQHTAMLRAWDSLQPGDRLIVIADIVEEALHTLHALAEGTSAATEVPCTAPGTLASVASQAIDLVNAGAVMRGHAGL